MILLIMKDITIYQIDAFTNKLFSGNPAGVVVDANNLTEEEMQKIAREMNLSETSFILNSDNCDFRLRYFTPETEVKFCGHATVSALHVIALENKFGLSENSEKEFIVETKVGNLKMKVVYKDEKTIDIFFDAPDIKLIETDYTHKEVADAMSIDPALLNSRIQIYREQTNNFLYVAVNSLTDLGRVKYDYNKFKKFTDKENIVVACFAVNETFNPNNNIHCRVFGPSIGLVEDPVTGAVQGGLVAFMHKTGLLAKIDREVGSEQGDFVGRSGSIRISLRETNGEYKATIKASALKVFKTELSI